MSMRCVGDGINGGTLVLNEEIKSLKFFNKATESVNSWLTLLLLILNLAKCQKMSSRIKSKSHTNWFTFCSF